MDIITLIKYIVYCILLAPSTHCLLRQRHLVDRQTASWLEWTPSTECSASCDGGFQQSNRECSTGRNADCEAQGGRSWKIDVCNQKPCSPTWSEWGPLSTCPKTCDTGVAIRRRNCSSGVNSDCVGQSYELQPCKLTDCIITTTTIASLTSKAPASWSAWQSHVACTTSCGPGFGERMRTCSSGNNNDCPGSYFEVTVCNKQACEVDGIWTQWSDWTNCPVTCGGGGSSRTRACFYPDPAHKGKACVGGNAETKECNTNLCPVDGTWTTWTAWSDCSKSCDSGTKQRARVCVFSASAPHGQNCSGEAKETQSCQLAVCPADGSWSDWSDWSDCTTTCGSGGIRFRARTCMFDFDRPHGKNCPGDTIERQTCTLKNCIANGVWNEWSTWSQCSHTCAGGKRSRSRVCLYTPGVDHGLPCSGGTLEIGDCGLKECPVNGIWSSWYPWSQCTVTCGTGRAVRNRTCNFYTRYPDTPHGDDCEGDQAQITKCNTDLCPVDAAWSTWTAFSTCSQTCGGGRRTKTRQCIYDEVAPIGIDCTGQSTVTEECSTNECPIDGAIQVWNSWSFCSVSCNGGVHTRTRDCYFQPNRPHGADCKEQLNETAPCNVQSCPTTTTPPTTTALPTADGHWSNWTSWTVCTLTCGGGQQYRERQCTYPDHTLHGQYCPGPQNQTQECNSRLCPVDGIWTQWSAYSKCSVSCANGVQTRTRQCAFDPRFDRGDSCPGNNTSTQLCDNGPCPVDGVFENWSTWNACPVSCGGGIQARVRVCHFPTNVPHGLDCLGISHENQTCGNSDCPVDGVLTEWSQWADCTLTCGGGYKIRNRTCYFPPDKPHGHDCVGNLNFSKACANHACPVDGVWNDWASWAKCSVTCGGGKQQRTRRCHYDGHNHGTACSGPDTETKDCSTDHCPIDGNWKPWNSWTSCSITCSNGTKSRTKECYFVPNEPKGNNCSGSATETADCNLGLCPVDGVWHSWATWSTCTVTCGNGSSSRDRVCDFPDNTPHGRNCSGSNSETRSCNAELCPVNGNYTAWGSWSVCSKTCGGGSQERNRLCVYDPVAPHGNNCSLLGASGQTQACMTENCPVNGIWSAWSNYTECTVTCGGGTRARLRNCDYSPGFPRGDPCKGPNNETQQCNNNPCPVDGKLSAWGSWDTCSKSCANGTQSRHRTCDYSPPGAPHGKPCSDSLDETIRCHTEKCPIAGHWSNWTNFTTCTLTCAGGTHTRNRTCIFDDPGAPHLSECFGNTTDTDACNTQSCPVDGVWGDWGTWHTCTVTCGGGQKVRDRTCDFPQGVDHGRNCTGPEHEIDQCSSDICPVDGKFTPWSSWTQCTYSCGSGFQTRIRKCEFNGGPPGTNCTGNYSETQSCSQNPCPVNGVWSQWNGWATCSVSCGGGTTSRDRICTYEVGPRGDNCAGPTDESKACEANPCPVDGQWSQWSQFTPCVETCGNGTKTRNRTCEYTAGHPHGAACPGPDTDAESCNTAPCPVDGVWVLWNAWTSCNVTCGGGSRNRTRECRYPIPQHGAYCVGNDSETETCNTNLCPVNGHWSAWDSWGSCTVTCDIGKHFRNRTCVYDPVAPKGARCPGDDHESDFCSPSYCPRDGIWTSWNEWSVCSTTCGTGSITRRRKCVNPVPAAPFGKDCEGLVNETKACTNTTDCAVDGNWSEWTSWSTCSVTCGNGDQSRNRTCLFEQGKPRGHDCVGHGLQNGSCTRGNCPVDGSWSAWAAWTICDVTCGGGTHNRSRDCYFPQSVPKGQDCQGDSSEFTTCRNESCPVDGVLGQWSSWTMCSKTCGGGTQSRYRNCTYPDDRPHGQSCIEQLSESPACNPQVCTVDGLWSLWSPWMACDVTCGNGTQSRSRNCTYPPDAMKGKDCVGGSGNETKPCSTAICTATTTTTTTATTTATLPTTTTTQATTTTATTTIPRLTPTPTTASTSTPTTTITTTSTTTPTTPSTTTESAPRHQVW
ncbi:SCO-spondin-like isoform X2 [Dreissena polymorpha]|uniref:SCO-spondin-like isoform X2 n=1 Tax=Dreissena polymorpha TaxID=45954 RepID=UPI0022652725|nr:SCO-spondin-like isoform X2 [Dreissena polymorpha]